MRAMCALGFISVCAAAGTIGYLVGQIAPPGDSARAGVGTDPGESSGAVRSTLELVAPRAISELRPSVAAALEAALAELAGDPFAALVSLQVLEDDTQRAEAIFELIGRMDDAQLGILVTGLASAEEGSVQAELLSEMFSSPLAPIAMFDRWAQLDPEAVIGFALSPIEDRGDAMMPLLIRALSIAFIAQSDPDTAFEVADQLRRDPVLRGGDPWAEAGMMIESVIGVGMAVSDPVASLRKLRERCLPVNEMPGADPIFEFAGPHGDRMLAEIMQFPAGEERTKLLAELYHAWGGYDLDSAIASIGSLPEGEGAASLLDLALNGAAELNPAGAARRIGLLPEGDGRRQVIESIVQNWSQREPVQALRWAQDNLGEREFIAQLQQASLLLPAAEGRALVEGLSDGGRAGYFLNSSFTDPNHYIMRMVREDPAAAVEWLGQQGGLNSLNGSVVGGVVAARGIDSAIEFAASLPETDWAHGYLVSVASEAGRSGSSEWLSWARSQGGAVHAAAVDAWAVEDPQAAAEYAEAVGEETLTRVVSRWAEDDPAAAYRWTVESQAGDPESVAELITSGGLLESWSREDPAAAAQAMGGFPDDLAGDYVGRVISAWAGPEPGRASEYVAEHFTNQGPVRDAVVLALVEQIAGSSPAEARAWAESVADESRRARLLESLQP